MTIDRREFLKVAGAQAGLLAVGARSLEAAASAASTMRRARAPHNRTGRPAPDVVVVGAGAWGGWTALNLQKAGARVLLVEQWGPGNSRSTSGDETRGVRSSYGDRALPQGEVWTRWARKAMGKWLEWDDTWGRELEIRHFFRCGDLIFRPAWEPFVTHTRELWDKLEVSYEVLKTDEVRYRWPVFDLNEIEVVLYEPDAGVVRARRACESVAAVFQHLGGELLIARAWPTTPSGGRLHSLQLSTGELVEAPTYVFACGPWLRKIFPEVLAEKLRTPTGNVVYFGSAAGDYRFTYPNLPTWNYTGVTGWPALPVDNSGFRVRTGGGSELDPDTSQRWLSPEQLKRPRDFVGQRFPILRDAPILRTHSCHYELGSGQNFIVDKHPAMDNVWIAGSGMAEGFKFGPVIGEYVANRVLGHDSDPQLVAQYRIPAKPFDASQPPRRRSGEEE